MAPLQSRIQRIADELVGSGAEVGLQVAVYEGGEQIVDVVAGQADSVTGRPVTADTPFYAYSVGKAMTAVIVHMLAERGAFGEAGYDAPIAQFWPEFAQHGKEGATIRHALTHTAGIPGLPSDVTPEEVCDWERICARVAGLEPWWKPGTATAYHAYTFGFILGELVRRVTGRPISDLLRTEIAEPLGVVGELWFGVAESDIPRVARLEDDPAAAGFEMPDDSPFWKLAPRAVSPDATFGNRHDVIAADIPAGGKVSARAVARMYAALGGEAGGVRLLPPERAAGLTRVAYSGTDEIFGMPSSWSLGLALGRPGAAPGAPDTWYGWGGVGGAYAGLDTKTGRTLGICKNRLSVDFETAARIAAAVAE
ncbi:serine hydrolase domain-containing protein [Spongiactinospora sp. TRM90649]|uniref:serine hydrolase domain-containing protein n=1 Tax=Spongiactinospora sp. TRM90649 TaxID=3031114 RepID=UPI0023F862EF|nr:serine hydrolase domain-containing protein [Spongiactinospora sp. TRM90649]MDF5752253.1 serine hydrolase [Spongiactinospora sp. TRM90649]